MLTSDNILVLRPKKTYRNLVLGLFIVACQLLPAQVKNPSMSPGEIYQKTSSAVVLIELYNDKQELVKQGSGFMISADGRILTNYHVIGHSKHATVRLANGDAYDDVQILDIDKRKDIALIKVKAVELPFLMLGKSNDSQIGDNVFALGNPLGVLQNTLSEGIISGIRSGDGYRYFQISAPISHGSSGGPIFNNKAEVIGIAVSSIESGQNLNFAVPIDYAKGMLASNQPRSLASVYEPEPEAEKSSNTGSTSGLPAEVTDEMRKNSFRYLEGKLGSWTLQDANRELNEPLRHRSYAGTSPVEIYAYPDPTKAYREYELGFSVSTKKLTNVAAYPWNMTWEEAKHIWGDDVRITKNSDGSRFYGYKKRHLGVRVNNKGTIQTIIVY